MFLRFATIPLAGAVLLLTGCEMDFGGDDQFQKDFHESRTLQPGGRLSVETFNGQVEITTWDQNTVDISGTKHASDEAMLNDLKVDIQSSGGMLSIRSVRPSMSHGSMGVRYILRVPRRLELDRITTSNGPIRVANLQGSANLRTSNGGIHIEHLDGKLDATTSNGAIELNHVNGPSVLHTSNGRIEGEELLGPVDATTSNGAIHLQLGSGASTGPLRFSTSNGSMDVSLDAPVHNELRAHGSNGSITLRFPDATNAHVHATTSNSGVTTDFPIAVAGTPNKHSLEGNIGSGGPLIEVSNSNGAIQLLRLTH